MAQNDNKPVTDDSEDQGAILQVIETFESILQAFPEDVGALESLATAYEQAGDQVKAHETYMELAKLMAQQEDWDKVFEITTHLIQSDNTNTEAVALLQHAESRRTVEPDKIVTTSKPLTETISKKASPLSLDLSGELELAWFLLQKELITQEQYEKAIAALTESRMKQGASVSLSFLQELASMDRVYIDRIVANLAAETSVPFIEVSRFQIADEVIRLIPMVNMRRLGILPFEMFKDEVLVALLNPIDENLRNAVAEFLGCRVHFYLTSPEQFQEAIDGIEARLKK